MLKQRIRMDTAIYFHHVRHSAKKVADLLANKGVNHSSPIWVGPLSSVNDEALIQGCTQLVHNDNDPPDASGT